MQIYKDLTSPVTHLKSYSNSHFQKYKLKKEKDGKINKITEKYVFLYIENLKSEPVLDINELKSLGLSEKIKIGETIPVLLEKIEDKHGSIGFCYQSTKIKGGINLLRHMKMNQSYKITSKCKGGCIVEHIDTGSLMFLPGSQISDKPLKILVI